MLRQQNYRQAHFEHMTQIICRFHPPRPLTSPLYFTAMASYKLLRSEQEMELMIHASPTANIRSRPLLVHSPWPRPNGGGEKNGEGGGRGEGVASNVADLILIPRDQDNHPTTSTHTMSPCYQTVCLLCMSYNSFLVNFPGT